MADIVLHEGSGSINETATEFTFGTRLGLVFIAEAASLSLVSCVVLLIYIMVRTYIDEAVEMH